MFSRVRGIFDRRSCGGWVYCLQTLGCLAGLSVLSNYALAQPSTTDGNTGSAQVHHHSNSPTNLMKSTQPEGTRRMIELLKQTREEIEAEPEKKARFSSDVLVAHTREALRRATNPATALLLKSQLATHLLEAGESEAALAEYDEFVKEAAQTGMRLDSREQSRIEIERALCYLRLGEQENCLTNHNGDSCLLPIQGGGIHKLQRGARGAISVLTAHLNRFPTDLKGRWLLNLAYMTVGEYPDKVPGQWLISPKVFDSDYDIKRFRDVAPDLGLDLEGQAGGCLVEDFDGDGYLDVMYSDWNLSGQLRLFHNNGDGTFTDRTAAAGLMGITGGLNMMQTDYNNDGLPDVFILRGAWHGAGGHQPRSLLRNNGDGTFEDVAEKAGLLGMRPSQTAAWFDFNGDGLLDVFVGNESTAGNLNPCQLYRNNGDGTFTECAEECRIAFVAFVKGVTAGDYNNDGRPDLFLSTMDGQNSLWRNDGPAIPGGGPKSKWKFTNVVAQAGVTEPKQSFPCWFWDYDNDGWLDIFVCGYSSNRDVRDVAADYLGMPSAGQRAHLYRNNGDGTFSDVTVAAGLNKVLLGMGANFGDLDNDGWLDFYIGTGNPDLSTQVPNRMFRNADGKFFQDVTTSGDFGHLQKGHGVAFADFDNDGDQDVFIKIGGAFTGDVGRNAIFLNPGHGNHWITLKLEGVRSNRAAIGARIRVIVENEKGERSIYKTVGSGGSFGASPLRQEIGLGQAKAIRSVEIFWPTTGQTQVVKDLALDHFYKIREGESKAALWDLKSFSVTAHAGAHVHHHTTAQ